jgi:hypothetical protein
MKAALEFDLSNPEDDKEFRRAINSTALALVIWDLINILYSENEYGIKEKDALKIQKVVSQILEKRQIDINSLID